MGRDGVDFGVIGCKPLCTELGVLYGEEENEASLESLVAAILLYSHSVLSSISICFQWFTFFSFAFLPWELFGNEGDTGLENGEVVLSGSIPKSSELRLQEVLNLYDNFLA